MDYSGDVIERVRAALMDYHAATATNGRKRTWSAIASDLHDEFLSPPVVDDENDEDLRDVDKPLAEALRRFAAGAQTPSPERLDALCRYLVGRSYLSEGDLNPAAPASPLFHALRSFFGASTDPAAARSFPIKGSYAASRKHSSGRTELAILTISDGDIGFAAAEDKLFVLPVAPQSTKREALARILRRTGGAELRFDGWLFQSQGQACLFVQDSLRKNPGVYTILDRKPGAEGSRASVLLLKSGDFGAPMPGYNREGLIPISKEANVREMTFARIRDNIWEYRQESISDAG